MDAASQLEKEFNKICGFSNVHKEVRESENAMTEKCTLMRASAHMFLGRTDPLTTTKMIGKYIYSWYYIDVNVPVSFLIATV